MTSEPTSASMGETKRPEGEANRSASPPTLSPRKGSRAACRLDVAVGRRCPRRWEWLGAHTSPGRPSPGPIR